MKNLSINGLQLKLIGWAFTLCTIAGIVFFPMDSVGLVKVILTYAGYISLPIFAFLLVEGFAYTQRMSRYVALLLISAVVTEPFYDYFCTGSWLNFDGANGQNFLFALVLGIIQLHFLQYMGTGNLIRIVASSCMVIASACWTFFIGIPSGFYFELMVGVFYLLHERERVRNWVAATLSLVLSGTAVLAIPLVTAYNDERGEYNKYLFYIIYPAIWIVAALVKYFAA